jgi:SAM-dependent methyltransferase
MDDRQRLHWDEAFALDPEFFGPAASHAAEQALVRLRKEGVKSVLELGAGQGRDAIFFARHGLNVFCVDYSPKAIERLMSWAAAEGLADRIESVTRDLRLPLPFADGSVESCYSHMLYCMNFKTAQIEALNEEIRRILKPGGLNILTVRHTGDPDYGKGIDHGDSRFENGGFIVRFFDRGQVERLAKGFDLVGLSEFEEGELPRRLFLVVLKK